MEDDEHEYPLSFDVDDFGSQIGEEDDIQLKSPSLLNDNDEGSHDRDTSISPIRFKRRMSRNKSSSPVRRNEEFNERRGYSRSIPRANFPGRMVGSYNGGRGGGGGRGRYANNNNNMGRGNYNNNNDLSHMKQSGGRGHFNGRGGQNFRPSQPFYSKSRTPKRHKSEAPTIPDELRPLVDTLERDHRANFFSRFSNERGYPESGAPLSAYFFYFRNLVAEGKVRRECHDELQIIIHYVNDWKNKNPDSSILVPIFQWVESTKKINNNNNNMQQQQQTNRAKCLDDSILRSWGSHPAENLVVIDYKGNWTFKYFDFIVGKLTYTHRN